MEDRGSGEVLRKEDNNPEYLKKLLKQGIVHFIYRKKPKKGKPANSGELREAWGTKLVEVIDRLPHNGDYVPHGGDCPAKRAGYTIYYDFERQRWRSYLDDNVIKFWGKIYTDKEFLEQFPDGIAYPIENLEKLQADLDLQKEDI